MATVTATISETITPEAADYLVKLGFWPAFMEMLEYTRQTVAPRSLSVRLDPPGHDDVHPYVMIRVEVIGSENEEPGFREAALESDWDRWIVETFEPDIHRHFMFEVRGRP